MDVAALYRSGINLNVENGTHGFLWGNQKFILDNCEWWRVYCKASNEKDLKKLTKKKFFGIFFKKSKISWDKLIFCTMGNLFFTWWIWEFNWNCFLVNLLLSLLEIKRLFQWSFGYDSRRNGWIRPKRSNIGPVYYASIKSVISTLAVVKINYFSLKKSK